jgi:probable rRNA maturation factor
MGLVRLSLSIQSPAASQPDVPYLRRHLLAAHRLLHPPLCELSIALVGDKIMSDLHQQFLGIPGPTDVLTFPLETDRKRRPISGEVVICVPEARRRCRQIGGNLRQELLLYALHGLLHLCGYDDRTDQDYRKMHRKEDQILSLLGVGPVFANCIPSDNAD